MFEKLTPPDFALAITNGVIIYQAYNHFTSTSDDTTWMMTMIIITFTLIICELKRNLESNPYQPNTWQ